MRLQQSQNSNCSRAVTPTLPPTARETPVDGDEVVSPLRGSRLTSTVMSMLTEPSTRMFCPGAGCVEASTLRSAHRRKGRAGGVGSAFCSVLSGASFVGKRAAHLQAAHNNITPMMIALLAIIEVVCGAASWNFLQIRSWQHCAVEVL